MAITWTGGRATKVADVLREHPKESGRCEQAAKAILPHARKEDASSAVCEVRPPRSMVHLILSPKASVGGGRWMFHATVFAQNHYVDALTTHAGTSASTYLETHFNYADVLTITRR
jgi:hypothetical protein